LNIIYQLCESGTGLHCNSYCTLL